MWHVFSLLPASPESHGLSLLQGRLEIQPSAAWSCTCLELAHSGRKVEHIGERYAMVSFIIATSQMRTPAWNHAASK